MKNSLLSLCAVLLLSALPLKAQTYVRQVYNRSTITVQKNIMYQANFSVLTGSPKLDTFRFDLYTPTGNTATNRPLVIFLHTGSYLPRYINQTPTGARDDSATVEFCMNMASRGYVVAAISYRLGWNPALPTEDERKTGIINAAYKSVQDISAAVRYFRKSVFDGNAYGIDSNKIVIGGQGTGSYAMYAHNAVTSQPEICISKFFDVGKGKCMVNDSLWGDRYGFKIPGSTMTFTFENHKSHTSEAQLGFAIGGAMGDTTWMQPGEPPLISVHGIYDPFAPYLTGMVYVPGTNLKVVEVSGGGSVMNVENKLGNNSSYAALSKNWQDPYTLRANILNNGSEGLFPIDGAANGSGPWEWWDPNAIRTLLKSQGYTDQQVDAILANGSTPNPLMSKSRALLYIDTAMNYIMPRVACALGLSCTDLSIRSTSDFAELTALSPNPAQNHLRIVNNAGNHLKFAQIMDCNGRVIRNIEVSNNTADVTLDLKPGLYTVRLQYDNGQGMKKLVVQ